MQYSRVRSAATVQYNTSCTVSHFAYRQVVYCQETVLDTRARRANLRKANVCLGRQIKVRLYSTVYERRPVLVTRNTRTVRTVVQYNTYSNLQGLRVLYYTVQ